MLIVSFNKKGWSPCLLNRSRTVAPGYQELAPEVRDTWRIIVDSPDFASWLFDRIKDQLPAHLDDGSRLVGINPYLRCLCYTPGQYFESHIDNRMKLSDGRFSYATVQIYLNTLPEFNGGATTFCPVCVNRLCIHEDSAACCRDRVNAKVQPCAGSVLMFSQDLRHEGSLLKGGVKYVIRTEAMYKRAKDLGRA